MTGMPTNETLIETEHNDPDPVLHPVHIEIGPLGGGTLTVDGHDLSNRVAEGGVTIQAGNRKTHTKVYLELLAGVTFDGLAEVHIIQGAHAVEFLQSVDPTALAEATLRGGFNRNPVDVMLELLIGMAQAIETGQEPE
jgi:hypothetical protein